MGARARGRQGRVPRAGSPQRRDSWNGPRATAQAGAERGGSRAAAAVSGRRGSGDWRPAEAEPSVPRAPEGEKKRHQQSGATRRARRRHARGREETPPKGRQAETEMSPARRAWLTESGPAGRPERGEPVAAAPRAAPGPALPAEPSNPKRPSPPRPRSSPNQRHPSHPAPGSPSNPRRSSPPRPRDPTARRWGLISRLPGAEGRGPDCPTLTPRPGCGSDPPPFEGVPQAAPRLPGSELA
ncbi:acidic proline-rich protein PRP25-like [Muntiacus reevesi]|uniref:acidic proline-rich protein PRP25-like n=1 Tax=Muntiacus reevesi TaxID=9886 RepID=UPI0033075EAE